MPCVGGYTPEQLEEIEEAKKQRERMNNIAEATLCAVFRAFEKQKGDFRLFLDRMGCFNQISGLTPEMVEEWWEDHQQRDGLRRRQEQAKLRADINRRSERLGSLKDEIAKLEQEIDDLSERLTDE